MTKILIILFLAVLTTQLTFGQLNKHIDRSQKEAILKSPFNCAKGMYKEVSRQKKIRVEYLGIVDSLRKVFPNDTILLIESYDFICFGCPAYYIQIQIGRDLIKLNKDYESSHYTRETDTLSSFYIDNHNYYHSDIDELITEIRKNDNWGADPKKYGTENCYDGGDTFYTVIYPDNKIKSLYMRCWINKEWRKN